MEDSGKHRFHGPDYDLKMRLFTTYAHTHTLRGHEASAEMLQQKYTNEERNTGNGNRTLHQMAGSTGARAITSADWRGKRGQDKGEPGAMQKIGNETKCESAGVEGGSVRNRESKTPSDRKTYQNALRTKSN